MAITQTLTTSFKAEILLGAHDFRAGGDTFKIALYSNSATLNANTTSYTSTNEVTGAGYTAGGATLTVNGVTTANVNASSGIGYVDFENVVWPNSTITARGALIYNTTPSATANDGSTLTNAAVAVLDFGTDKSSIDNSFTVSFPTANASSAIIKVS